MTITADTNVLVYALDERDPAKQVVARQVLVALASRGSLLALQVIGELQNVLTRRLRRPHREVAATVAHMLSSFGSFGYARRDVVWALEAVASGRLGYWDALLVASAHSAGQAVLVTEDMADGSRIGGVEIVNPFGSGGVSDRARTLLSF